MLVRIHGKITIECDDCADVLDTGEKDFDAARSKMNEASWRAFKNGNEWEHYCPQCHGGEPR